MARESSTAGHSQALHAISELSRDIHRCLSNLHSSRWPDRHAGRKFKARAARYAADTNLIEARHSASIRAAAAEITQCCRDGWEKDPDVLNLWHQLVLTLTNLSEHPDPSKRVATLIIDKKGNLRAFAANKTPDGLDRHGGHYVKGIRKDFIVCSERIALARLLGVKLAKPPKWHRGRAARTWQVAKLTIDIMSAAVAHSDLLQDSYVLTTTSPCEICAHTLTPFHPRGILTNHSNGNHFTRWDSILRGTEHLIANGINISYLPGLVIN